MVEPTRNQAPDDGSTTQTITNPSRASPEQVPVHIGRYRILRVIGEGGMGTVYEAEQEKPRRTVALKVIRPGHASPQLLKRFEQESQVLGRLQHPGIVQIYEAGVHTFDQSRDRQAAVPYFAMEFIRGRALKVFMEVKNLGTQQRLELVAKVCDAVHHAHQKGVIHRDLKPGNILVDESGQPKILDFGVARATDSDIQAATIQTDVGQIIGTLPYMSPEQVAADPQELDIRSDVYALGVVLYEALAGRLPYDLKHKMIHEAARVIREEEPAPLSTVNRVFRGDVETIVSKSLEKDRTRRYQSAAELASDIRRYLHDEPIVARPASAAYQFRKFAKRNKALVISTAAVFFVLLAGMIVSTTLYVRAETARAEQTRERERAEQEAQTSKQVTEFLVNIFEVSDPSESRGNTITAREILDKGADKIAKELKDQPLVQATLMDVMGKVYGNLGLYDAAEPLLQTALHARRNILGTEHWAVAETLHNLGVSLFDRGSYDSSEQFVREALAMRRKLLGNEHPDLAESLRTAAKFSSLSGDIDGMERLVREELAIRRKCLPEGAPPDRKLAMAMNNLAFVSGVKGEFDEAERLYIEGLAASRTAVGDVHPDVAESLRNLGSILREKGDLDAAERVSREALVILQKVYGNEHVFVADQMLRLGEVAIRKGDDHAAEPLLEEALRICQKVVPDGGRLTAALLCSRALLLVRTNRPGESEAAARECLAMIRRSVPEESHRIPEAESILGACLSALQRYEEAEPLLLKSYHTLVDQAARTSPSSARIEWLQKLVLEGLQRIVTLYDSWDAAEPGKGYAEKAAAWRAKLEEASKSQNAN